MKRSRERKDDTFVTKRGREREDEKFNKLQRSLLNSVRNGSISIEEKEICRLRLHYSNREIVEALSNLICSATISFPFKRFFIEDVDQKFKNLQNYAYHLKYDEEYEIPQFTEKTSFLRPFHFRGRFTLLPSETKDYDEINILSDYFQEEARVKSVAGYNNLSSMNVWLSPSHHLPLLHRLLQKQKGLSSYQLRELIYQVSRGEPSAFKATVSLSIVRILHGTRILDFCSGWGDRLLGALACEDQVEKYVGIDPNKDLFQGYQQMISRFAAHPERFEMICSSFENYEGQDNFDLIFTGPPYFDYEKYGENDQNQSIQQYPTPEDWTVRFLFRSIFKSWESLKDGGFLALNVNDVRSLVSKGIFFTEAMNLFIQYKLPGACYEGVICFTGANKPLPRPIWIYQKVGVGVSQRAGELLQEYYPKLFLLINQHFGTK